MHVSTKKLSVLSSALVLALAVTACSGDKTPTEKKAAASSAAAATSPPAPPEPVTEPLTGVEVSDGVSVDRPHSVLVVKMDNTYSSSPQVGLSKADMVVEELVEGGLTRLAAFFYSKTPDVVGPVRSMRASDIGIVTPVHASVVTSGAASVTISRIQRAKIRFFQEGVDGISRNYDRAAPYNVFANLKTIGKAAKNKSGRPADYLPWGSEADFVGVKPAKAFDVSFGFGHTSEWEFANGKYVNTNSYAGENDQFPADSVLVLKVVIGDAGYTDPANNPVPETKLEGSGIAFLFHDGKVMRGRWHKDSLRGTISLTNAAGDLMVPAGHVWLELVPRSTGGVTLR